MRKIINLGIDWEDFALIFYEYKKIKDYKIFKQDFYKENYYLFEFLKKESIKAIFFCNGRTAEIYPDLVKEIIKNGHEVAAHGYLHKHRDSFNDAEFYEDSLRVKNILQDLTNQEVIGYRSPYLSLNKSNYLSSLRILQKAGYKYDSSITYSTYLQIKKNNYEKIKFLKNKINIQTLFSVSLFNLNINLAGGSMWRLLPSKFIEKALKMDKTQKYISFYFHPYEFGSFINPERALDLNPPLLKKSICWLRWNLGRNKIENLLKKINNSDKVKFKCK